MSETTVDETFDEIVSNIQPEIDDTGLPVIPGRRRSLKIGVYAEGFCDTFVFAPNLAEGINRARQEFNIPDDVPVEAKRVEEGVYLKFRLN